MKKLLLITLCGSAVIGAWGQGQVRFVTKASTVGINAPLFDEKFRFPVEGKDGFVAQLYFSLPGTGGPLSPVGAPVAFANDQRAGYIYPAVVVTFPVTGTVDVQVRAWNQFIGATYEAAAAGGSPLWNSLIFPVTLQEPPNAPAYLVGFEGFLLQEVMPDTLPGPSEVVPEPSTVALGGIGLGILLLRRRKGRREPCLPPRGKFGR